MNRWLHPVIRVTVAIAALLVGAGCSARLPSAFTSMPSLIRQHNRR